MSTTYYEVCTTPTSWSQPDWAAQRRNVTGVQYADLKEAVRAWFEQNRLRKYVYLRVTKTEDGVTELVEGEAIDAAAELGLI